jgi:hypothetical protein
MVARVVTRGDIFIFAIRKPLKRPQAAPVKRVAIMPPALPKPRAAIPPTMALSTKVEPIERSMPPVITMRVPGRARRPISTMFLSIIRAKYLKERNALLIEEIVINRITSMAIKARLKVKVNLLFFVLSMADFLS